MLKVRLNCPLCGENILAKSLEGHILKVHELTGTVTLRLNPTHPYAHEPEAETEPEPEPEPEPTEAEQEQKNKPADG